MKGTFDIIRCMASPRANPSAGIAVPVPACPVAAALDVIGEKWTILVLRDLSRHPSRRFQDFIESLKGCAPNTLSARLVSLERHGLIQRRLYEARPPRNEYLLTDAGRAVLPVLDALSTWGRSLQAAAAGA